jgi:hypothetical protein
MKERAFVVLCVLNAVGMFTLSVWGMVDPSSAMSMMTGLQRSWDAETLSLMRMHNGADFGTGTGFLLCAWKPRQSFPAFVLCLVGNIAHGLVHVADEATGHHHAENLIPLTIIFLWAIVLALLYPWRESWKIYSAPAPQ